MSSPLPFDVDDLRSRLTGPAGHWARIDVVDATGSTNADLLARAADGAPDGSVLVTEHQTAGRGRLDRGWDAPRGSGIAVSVLWRPEGVGTERLGWLPMLAGIALLDAIRRVTPELEAGLKWPNDLLLGPGLRKGAGILAEVAAPGTGGLGVVLGIGVNVGAPASTLPEGATSLTAEGAAADRTELLVALLRELGERQAAWRAAGGDADECGLRGDYRANCLSLGSDVRVEMPGGSSIVGIAEDVDTQGHLLVLEPDGNRRTVAAGDIVHLRPADRPQE